MDVSLPAASRLLLTNSQPCVETVWPEEHTVGGGGAACQVPVKKQAVKRHHHKHNLKHRYEFLETLGKGTYGKVKKARERSGRLVSKEQQTFICYSSYGNNHLSVESPRLQPSVCSPVRLVNCKLEIRSYF